MDTFKKQEGLKQYFETAYAFVVFATVAKAGFGVGAAGGTGDVYINNKDGTETKVGESTMMQVSFGFQFGGQVYSEIIFFETARDLDNFTSGNFEFGADANVVALTASASTSLSTLGNQGIKAGLTPAQQAVNSTAVDVNYVKGMCVFTVSVGGLMYQATISGQKFTYKPVAQQAVPTTSASLDAFPK